MYSKKLLTNNLEFLIKNGIEVVLTPQEFVTFPEDGGLCVGYYCETSKKVVVATKHYEWELTLTHEKAHAEQDLLCTKAWGDYMDNPGNLLMTAKMEHEAECMTVQAMGLFGETGYSTEATDYRVNANKYLAYHIYCHERNIPTSPVYRKVRDEPFRNPRAEGLRCPAFYRLISLDYLFSEEFKEIVLREFDNMFETM